MTSFVVDVSDDAGDDFLYCMHEGVDLATYGCTVGGADTLTVNELPPLLDSAHEAIAAIRNKAHEAQRYVDVVVPEGCFAGDVFHVESGNAMIAIIVPDRCLPGMVVTVEVASGASEPPKLPPIELCDDEEPQWVASPRSVFASEADLADGRPACPGDVVILDGLKAKSFLNGEVATLLSWNATKARWSVSLGRSCGDLPPTISVKPGNLRATRPASIEASKDHRAVADLRVVADVF